MGSQWINATEPAGICEVSRTGGYYVSHCSLSHENDLLSFLSRDDGPLIEVFLKRGRRESA